MSVDLSDIDLSKFLRPNPLLLAALDLAAAGLPVVPVWEPTETGCGCGDPNCRKPGKHPTVAGWNTLATTDPDRICEWWGEHPTRNVGVLVPKGFAVLDVDPRHGGNETMVEWAARHGPIPPTWMAETGGGGWHVWFREPPGGRLVSPGPGVDIRRDGNHQVVGPGSIHASGGSYSWIVDSFPGAVEVAEAPAELLEKPKKPRKPRDADSAFAAAADRWLAEHFVDHANRERICPACGHRGCFGRHKLMPHRWACWSANHGPDSGNLGSPNEDGTVWRFDEIDLEAKRRCCTPREVLVEDGFLDGVPLVPEPERDPAVIREVLPLTDARERALDLISQATQSMRSLDLAGEAGLGKSHAAILAEVDRLTAWNGEGRPPVSLIAVGGSRDLALQRAEEVRRVVADLDLEEDVAVRVGLGRQEPSAGAFRCVVAEESSARVRWGFAGCAGCPHAPREPDGHSLCSSTPGHYLHDWGELRSAIGRPAVVVLPVAALPTYWHRVGTGGKNLRVVLDDADDVHAGLLTSRDVERSTLRAAWTTACEGRRLARAAGRRLGSRPLDAVLVEAADHDSLSPLLHPPADPLVVAWLLRIALRAIDPAGRVRRERLGEFFEALVRRRPRLTNYVSTHPFAGGAAWMVAQNRGERWHGLGLGATVWNLLREHVATRGLPTVENRGDAGRAVLSADHHLAAAARAGRVVRLGVAPLPAFVRDAVGIGDAVEVIVPTTSCAVAPGLPRGRSHGRRGGLDTPTIADRTADAIVDDLRAAHPGRTLAIGGLRDERRADGRYPVCVVGRDDRATNAHRGAVDALVLRRVQAPFDAALGAVSAVLAGLALPRPAEAPSGSPELGRTPSGAILPMDDAVRAAWIAQRTSALRNGTGRARAVERRDRVVLVLMDQDAGRWPWMLGGIQVEACEIDELPDRLGLPMPTLLAELKAMRDAHDPNPGRTAERIAAIEAAVAGGARTVAAIARTTGISERAVGRLVRKSCLVLEPAEFTEREQGRGVPLSELRRFPSDPVGPDLNTARPDQRTTAHPRARGA